MPNIQKSNFHSSESSDDTTSTINRPHGPVQQIPTTHKNHQYSTTRVLLNPETLNDQQPPNIIPTVRPTKPEYNQFLSDFIECDEY